MSDTTTAAVFLSYASPDRERVLPFYEFLQSEGFRPWMDVKDLLPGQRWEFEIQRALDAAALVVLFISEHSVDRTGYVQKELRLALNKLEQRPLHHIYLVPVVLDRSVAVPLQLKDIQCLYADLPDCYNRLKQSLTHQMEQLGRVQARVRREAKVDWSFGRLREAWEGLPGYDIDVVWPIYSSERYPQVSQAGEIIKGTLVSAAAHQRLVKLDQSPDLFSFGQNQFVRTNLYHVQCRDPSFCGAVVSQQVAIRWYGAGAAHPNLGFRTWVFLLEPLVPIDSLSDPFVNPKEALPVLQAEIRDQLKRNLYASRQQLAPDDDVVIDDDWIDRGTEDWSDLQAFTFEPGALAIAFPPYQVASYADGPQFARVSYERIVHLMTRAYTDALGITHLTYGPR